MCPLRLLHSDISSYTNKDIHCALLHLVCEFVATIPNAQEFWFSSKTNLLKNCYVYLIGLKKWTDNKSQCEEEAHIYIQNKHCVRNSLKYLGIFFKFNKIHLFETTNV